MAVACFPCSVNNRPCLLDGRMVSVMPSAPTWRDAVIEALGPSLSGCCWFAVALWPNYPRALFPKYEGYMNVPHAFDAVEGMMRFYRLWSVPYASVYALDGSLVYRAYRVWVHLGFEEGMSDE